MVYTFLITCFCFSTLYNLGVLSLLRISLIPEGCFGQVNCLCMISISILSPVRGLFLQSFDTMSFSRLIPLYTSLNSPYTTEPLKLPILHLGC